ncbi:MAG: ABC transporter ATP-binding protein [Halobacteria archaeon]|nr:ABC transporter ATP-binding protein [Halobacteria archaeon]
MIESEGLRKEYGGFVAVDDVNFSVEPGEIFGIVGPNGAGKTTTLKMLAGLVEPTEGSARVAGYDSEDAEMRRYLGYLPEESPLYEDMTARSYLRFFADLYDVPRDTADERIEETLDRLDLEHRERRIGDMSKGMKRKVAITRSLVNDPDVLIYDEPASGLDPLTTNYIIEFTQELKDEGKTVVFSAHNLYHVESVCDRVVILNEGRVVARGTLEEIREEHGGTEYHVYTTEEVPGYETTRKNGRLRTVVDDMDEVEKVRSSVEETGGEVVDIRTQDPSLEEIFLDVAETTSEREPERAAASNPDEESRTTTWR